MFISAFIESLKDCVHNIIKRPIQTIVLALVALLMGNIWETLLVPWLLNRFKAWRATDLPPTTTSMARPSGGPWRARAAAMCRKMGSLILYILQSGTWVTIVFFTLCTCRALTFKKLFSNLLESIFSTILSLLIGGMWEMIWLFLLPSPYMKLSVAQYNCQMRLIELDEQVLLQWKLVIRFWSLALTRAFLRIWGTGKWVAILALAFMEKEKGEWFLWYLKVPFPTWFISLGVTFLPYIFNKLKGLWRQPSRRHGSHET